MDMRAFHVSIGEFSEVDYGCRSVSYAVDFVNQFGERIRQNYDSLVYGGLLSDPDQLPWLIASTLRTLMEGEVMKGTSSKRSTISA